MKIAVCVKQVPDATVPKRIDPATNKAVAEISVAPGSYTVAFADNTVWVTSTEKSVLTRVNARTMPSPMRPTSRTVMGASLELPPGRTEAVRGIRHGWLDRKAYQPLVDRAWQAILARTGAGSSMENLFTI